MTPTFDQIVDWLKTLEEGQAPPPQTQTQFPKAVQFPGQFAPQFASPAQFQYAAKAPERPGPLAWNPVDEAVPQPASDGKSEPDAATAVQTGRDSIRSLLSNLTGDRLVQGIVLSEILGRPAALKRSGRTGMRR